MSTLRANPYVGPRPFLNRNEAFFGRDTEIAQLHDLTVGERMVLLYSPSGAGKSSLLNARLIPDLGEAGFEVLPTIRIGASTAPTNANRYIAATMQALDEGLSDNELHDISRNTLEDYLKDRRRAPERLLLLIFDQFEDILTHDPTDEAGRTDFFAQIGQALSNYSIYALFSMREEYVPALDPYLRSIPNRLNARMRMTGLSEEGATKAITEPAKREGIFFEAAADLVKALQMTRVIGVDGKPEDRRGLEVEGLQLQVVCDRLWRALTADQTRISSDDLVRSGGTKDAADTVEAALAGYYGSKVAECSKQVRVSERTIRKWFEARLITKTRLRAQVMQGDVEIQGLPDDLVRLLIDSGLVRAEMRRGVRWYELAHDRFIDPVLKSNAEYFRGNSDPIEQPAALWKNEGRPPKLLLEGERLVEAERWALSIGVVNPLRIDPLEEEFLRDSLALRDSRAAEADRMKAVERRTNLGDLGWGVIFAEEDADTDHDVREALQELLQHRKREAGTFYKEFRTFQGHTASRFLLLSGVGSGPVVPDKVPYYLLIVGPPTRIPFEFQYGFGTQYAVGRIAFDTVDKYRSYAHSVVICETGHALVPRKLAVFAPTHPLDIATMLARKALFDPLTERLGHAVAWSIEGFLGDEATKDRLLELLDRNRTALLMAGGHAFTPTNLDDANWQRHQLGLLCAGWNAPEPIKSEHLLYAEDIPDEADVLGMMAFLLTPHSAGTPLRGNFEFRDEPKQIAPEAMVGSFPMRLLGHPNGGALALIGHVDNLWSVSFREGMEVTQFGIFETVLRRLMEGHTVGSSMEVFRQRYTLVASQVAGDLLLPTVVNRGLLDRDARHDLHAMVDLRNYIILGDPAARLTFELDRSTDVRPSAAKEETVTLTFNGIDAATGTYCFPPVSAHSLRATILGRQTQIIRPTERDTRDTL